MVRVEVKPELLRWALARSGRDEEPAPTQFAQLPNWLDGTIAPTLRQLETFARWTRTPFGYLLLESPPEDRLSIPDFRTTRGRERRPSPDLLETVQAMQRRQEWMREFLVEEGQDPLAFVGEAKVGDSPETVAQSMRAALQLSERWARQEDNWTNALRRLRLAIEDAGVMAVINGVVGNNNHRPLDAEEFRGFALVDSFAPLIFVNGRDAKCAQMFTLAHELAHIWVGQAGVSNLDRLQAAGPGVERFCNRIAAEFLVPARHFEAEWESARLSPDRFTRIARSFKVSAVVIAFRALNLGHASRTEFLEFHDRQIRQEARRNRGSRGGDFWNTQGTRIGDLFGSAVAQAVWSGRLLYHEAYELTGLQGKTFDNYVAKLGL